MEGISMAQQTNTNNMNARSHISSSSKNCIVDIHQDRWVVILLYAATSVSLGHKAIDETL